MNDDLDILNLKNNFLPKRLVPLEDLFDSNDVARKPKMEPLRTNIEEVNIGTKDKPKLIKYQKPYLQRKRLNTSICLKSFMMYSHGVMKT